MSIGGVNQGRVAEDVMTLHRLEDIENILKGMQD